MTEYEMAELVNSNLSNMLTGQAIYFTQLGSYLVVAYLVGARLSRLQVVSLNFFLVLLTFSGMSNITTLLMKNVALIEELRKIGSVTVANSPTQIDVVLGVYLSFRLLILLAALIFMWQIRHPKAE